MVFAKPDSFRADRVRFLGLASSASGGLLAVGERGVVARRGPDESDWSLQRLPTRQSLTSAGWREDGVALAVGHGGAGFRSEDAGKTWQTLAPQLEAHNTNRDPWLGLFMSRGGGIWLMGGFGLLVHSNDAGRTWQRITPIDADFDRHLYGMTERVGGGYLLQGESGSLAESADGQSWRPLVSPYEGSWFGGLQTAAGTALAYGMRGQVFRQAAGQSAWVASEGTQATHAWVASAQLKDGSVVVVGGQGVVAVSRDDGRTFVRQTVWEGSLSGIAQDARGQIWLSGTQGLKGFDENWKALA